MSTKTLNNLRIGQKGIVMYIMGEGQIKRRLLDMGITPGTEITLKKKAPLGDPLEISIRGYDLSLRMNEAKWIVLKGDENI